MRVVVEVQDLQPGDASSYSVASYVRAVLKVKALRKEVAQALLEVERCKKTLEGRLQAGVLLAEADRLIEGLGGDGDIDDHR